MKFGPTCPGNTAKCFGLPLLTVFNGVPLYTKGVTFLLKMEYKRVRGWTSGRSLPDKTLLITRPLRGGIGTPKTLPFSISQDLYNKAFCKP